MLPCENYFFISFCFFNAHTQAKLFRKEQNCNYQLALGFFPLTSARAFAIQLIALAYTGGICVYDTSGAFLGVCRYILIRLL